MELEATQTHQHPLFIEIHDPAECERLLARDSEMALQDVQSFNDDDIQLQHGVSESYDDRFHLELEGCGETIPLRSASSCLMVPISFEDAHHVAFDLLLKRRAIDAASPSGSSFPLWTRDVSVPLEVNELSLHFRRLAAVGTDFHQSEMHRLQMTREALHSILPHPRLWGVTLSGKVVGRLAQCERVELLLFPHGALMSIQINWMVRDASFALGELRNWVYLAKLPNVRVGVTRGWSFGGGSSDASRMHSITLRKLRQDLGDRLFHARFGDQPCGLASLVSYLVKMPAERTVVPRCSLYQYALHHTIAQVAEGAVFDPSDPAHAAVAEQLAHLDGAASATPARERFDEEYKVFRPRTNRSMFMSPEGVFGIEWGESSEMRDIFLGLLHLLVMHVIAEKITLIRLSFDAAIGVKELARDTVMTLGEKIRLRSTLIALCTKLVKYNLAMSTDHCGGRPVVREFFRLVRLVMRISDLRLELREGLNDTLGVVDMDYKEDQRVRAAQEASVDAQKSIIRAEQERLVQRQRDITSVIVSIAGAVVLPFTVISGIFGMNNADLPSDTSWGWVIGGTGIGCAALMIIIIVVFFCTRPNMSRMNAQLLELDAKRVKSEGVVGHTYRRNASTWHATGAATFGAIDSRNARTSQTSKSAKLSMFWKKTIARFSPSSPNLVVAEDPADPQNSLSPVDATAVDDYLDDIELEESRT